MAVGRGVVHFEDVRIPENHLLGEEGIALLFGTEDQVEGMSVFLEKREAKCTGE